MNNAPLTKIITIGYPILIFLGIVRVFFFYNYFGIDIIPYLEIGEILLSFLNEVVFSIISLAILLTMTILNKNEDSQDIRKNLIKKAFKVRTFYNRLIIYLNLFIIESLLYALFLSIFYAIYGSIAQYFFSVNMDWWIVLYFIIAYLILITLMIIYFEIEIIAYKNSFNKFEANKYRLYYLISIVICIIGLSGYYEAKQLMLNNKNTKSIISLNSSEVLISDNENFYIGKTKNYLFYYHAKDKSYEVLPTSEVKKNDL